jgi:multidrug efflux pump subunit AcrB
VNISAWAIRHPIPPILLFALLIVVGLASFKALKIQNYPDVTIPIVTITASLPGATPSQLEAEVTRKIEDRVASIGAVNHISSLIRDEVSVTTVDMDLDTDPQVALSDVRDAVASVRSLLPPGITEPIISRYSITATPILTYLVEAPTMDELDLSWFVDDIIARDILSVKDVEKVQRQGGVDREVRVELDPAKLLALNTTASDVSLRLHNVQQEASGGRVDVGTAQQVVRTIGTVPTAEALSRLVLPLGDGRIARLSEVANIHDGPAERHEIALYDGKPVVGFQVFRSATSSEVAVAVAVRKVVAQLAIAHPGVKIREIGDTVKPVKDTYDVSMWALYEGAIFAVLVVWLFLRDLRATIVSAAALPLSIIPAFAAMYYLGFSLNTVTLLALTLVVGILVDDAIVEVENIVRHLRMGRGAREAALEASNEIGMAVIATTFTLVAVFLPTAFMGGMAGQFFKQFGWTASVAVLASLLVARLLTPMMSAVFLKPGGGHPPDGRVMQRYLDAVQWCLVHPRITVGLAAAFLAASLSMVAALSTSFMPAEDSNQIALAIETPPGNSLEGTVHVMAAVREAAMGMKDVTHVYGVIDGDVRKAKLMIDLAPRKQRKRSQAQVEAELRERLQQIPAARFSIGTESGGAKMSFTLVGDDPVRLEQAAHAVLNDIRGIAGLGNVSSSADLLRPEVHIVPDFARAADLGVTAAAIGQAVRVATIGDYDVSLPKLNLPDRQLPIRVQLTPAARGDLQTIAQLRVPGNRGTVPLENVAQITVASGPSQITRFDRMRNVTIDVELGGRVLGEVTQLINALPSMAKLPEGVRRADAGDAEKLQEMMSGFAMAMSAGILCVYLVLVLLFDDFLQPVTILAALPLAVGGALGVLVALGYSMSMSALIGLLMLMGIVTKNSILLVEYAITARKEQKLPRTAAIVDACHKRARPIVMTTCAMVAGMVPLALGLEGESSFRGPMAVVVIGGLLTSTVLSLLVVPVVYELIDDFEAWMRRIFKRAPQAELAPTRET